MLPNLKAFLTDLAARHGVNLDKSGAWLLLRMPNRNDLLIERDGPATILFHDLTADGRPRNWLHLYAPADGAWSLLWAKYASHFKELAVLTECGDPLAVRPNSRADATAAVEGWADDLRAAGWIERGRRPDPQPRAA